MSDLTGAVWRKSSRSQSGNQCVEVADNLVVSRGVVGIRDSKDPHGPAFAVVPRAFTAFVDSARTGALDV